MFLEIRVCSVEYSFRHRLHSFQQPCPCQREIDRGTERNTDRYHTEYRTQSLVYPMARLQDCRCGMGYGHRLYGSQRILRYLADGQRLPPDHIHSLFQYEKRNSGTISGSHTSVMLRRIGMGVILTLLCGVFSEELISCVIDSEGIREYGTPLVRTLLLSGPVMGILFIYINTLQAIGAEAAQPVAEFFPSFWLFGCFGGLKREWGKPPLLFNLRSLSDITCHYLIAVWKGISFRGSGINLNGCSALYPQ